MSDDRDEFGRRLYKDKHDGIEFDPLEDEKWEPGYDPGPTPDDDIDDERIIMTVSKDDRDNPEFMRAYRDWVNEAPEHRYGSLWYEAFKAGWEAKIEEEIFGAPKGKLTEEEVERLRDIAAYGPLTKKPIDDSLLEKRWIQLYDESPAVDMVSGRTELLYDDQGKIKKEWL